MLWWNDYWPMPWMFGPVLMILFMLVCLGVMVFMMRGGMRHRSRGGYALEILRERFARGEISQSEYEERRRLLEE